MADFDPLAMDDAAAEAENELSEIEGDSVEIVANWMFKWYMKAGYKRLGRILVTIGKEQQKKEG